MTRLIDNVNKYLINKFMKPFAKIINSPNVAIKTTARVPRDPFRSLEG